jgi:hypothetical protein
MTKIDPMPRHIAPLPPQWERGPGGEASPRRN